MEVINKSVISMTFLGTLYTEGSKGIVNKWSADVIHAGSQGCLAQSIVYIQEIVTEEPCINGRS